MAFSQPHMDPAMEREFGMNPLALQIDIQSKFKTIETSRSARSRRESRNAHVHASTIVNTRVLLLLVGFPLMIASTYAENIEPTSSNKRLGKKNDIEYPPDHDKYLALREEILQEVHNVRKTGLDEKGKSPYKEGKEMEAGINENNLNRAGDLVKLEDEDTATAENGHINDKNGNDTRRKNENNLRRRSLDGNENINVHVDIGTKTTTDDQVASDEVSKEASYGGDYGGGYGGGYGRENSGYRGRNYCPSRCMNSILEAKKCKAWFYDCTRYYGWCAGGGGDGNYGGYRNLQEKISKQTVAMGKVDVHFDTSGVNVTDFTNAVNMTDSTNATKAASLGYGGDFGYGGGKEYCPYRCMSAIAHAKKCKAYYPSCNGYFGWCGHVGHGGFGGGGGYGGYGGGYDGDFGGWHDGGGFGRGHDSFGNGYDDGFGGGHDGGFGGRHDGGFGGRHDGSLGGGTYGIFEGGGDYDRNYANTYENNVGDHND